ncbi:hypothetical protein GCM10028786_29310 [Flaviaesturariibacter terrae]
MGSGASGSQATGVQGTYILTTSNAGATAPVLLDQGYYPASSSFNSDWTVASSVASGTTSYNFTGTPAKIALVHYDKAYNYSSATIVTLNLACSSPTLSGVSSSAACAGSNTTVSLTGLLASTAQTVSYNINSGTTQTSTVTSDASGNASFTTAVTAANNGQTLAVTSIVSGSCTSNFNSSNSTTLTVNALPSAPAGTTGASRCGTGTVNISVADPGAGYTIDWYSAASGGSVLSGGSGTAAFTTPSISASTTYYAETRNSTTGCVSSGRTAVTATINGTPTITPTNLTIAQGASSGSLVYTSTNTPNQYAISYDATAQAAGFADVSSTTLTASPLTLAVPPAAAAGTYNGSITVSNSSTGCSGSATAFTVTLVGPYTWTGAAGDGLLATPANWSPSRTAANSDVLVFDGSVPTASVTAGGATTIGSLQVKGGAAITLNAASAATLTVTNGISISGSASALTQSTNLSISTGVGSVNSIASGCSMTISAGTFTLGATNTTASMTVNGALNLTAGTYSGANGITTVSGAAASLVYGNGATLTGNTTATLKAQNGGTIEVVKDNVASLAATYTSGATLKFSNAFTDGADKTLGTGVAYENIWFAGNFNSNHYFRLSNSPAITINGQLKVSSTGSGVVLITSASGTTGQTVGSLLLTGGTINVNRDGSGTRALTVTGDVQITGGTLDIKQGATQNTLGQLNIGGNLSVSGSGVISKTGGNGSALLVFNGSTQTVSGLSGSNISGSFPITVASSNGLTLLDAMTVRGNLSLSSGILDVAGNSLSVMGNISRSTGAISCTSGTLAFTGSSAQDIAAGAVSGNISNLSISNTSGSTPSVSINAYTAVDNTLTLSSGTLGVATYTLDLNGPVVATSGSLSSSASGTVNFNMSADGQNIPAANYGNLGLTGGQKILSAGTTGVSNTFTVTASGSHTVAGSTVSFNGSGNQSIPAFPYEGLQTATGGTKTLASSLNLSGTLTIGSGSTLASANNNIALTGSWIQNGSFTPGTATVSFWGTGAQSFSGSAMGSFYTLSVSKSAGSFSADALTGIGYRLQLESGSVVNANNLVIADGGKIIRQDGSLDAAPNFLGNVDLEFANSSDLVADAEVPVADIVRNVTVNGGGMVTLNKSVTVNGALTLTSGKLDVAAYDLTVAAGSVSGGSTTSYVKTSGAGALHIKSVGPSAQAFPVGNSTYNPLDLSSGTMQGWKVRVEDAIANVSAGYTANLAKAVSRQWDLVPDSANPVPSPGVTATFYYNGTTDVGASFSNATDVQLWHYDATGGWAKRGSAVTPATVNGLKAATVSGLTYFSPFALSNIDAPLPVSLLAFTGKRANNVNELKWITASESNNRGFAIERSADGSRFTEVGFVASRAQGGTSTSDISYSYNESITAGTKWYYRLKQQDLDGQYKYSAVVLLKGDKSGILTLDGIYPNPVKGTASIRLQASAQGGSVVLQLTDMLGKVVRTQPVLTEAGSSTTVQMNVSGLPAGQYHLKAFTANGDASETVTLIKQ